ncbi:helix-turn-helix domain-containing protein [Flavobacterium sp. RHBU_24]|uniref:helix-turn-helix domain-containing protein n=1 Tax=Flavobacterium sp. RHBU_24 TaxID=3391185 RepID=UPI0039854E15
MPKKSASIPVHTMPDKHGLGIAIGKATAADLDGKVDINQVHRDAYHVFFLQEQGTTRVEVDFQEHVLQPHTIAYIHPLQVHRVMNLSNVSFFAMMVNSENLNPEYIPLLQSITPSGPLTLTAETFYLLTETASLCIKLCERRDDKLYQTLLKDCCNTLVGLIISQYSAQAGPSGSLLRYNSVTRDFKAALERDFLSHKRPSAYAAGLNISTAYLNECVKNATGFPVSHHIRERMVLEAKRLLYHSAKSVKEIANELGYDDYPYFSRLFAEAVGMTALAFRNKNHD